MFARPVNLLISITILSLLAGCGDSSSKSATRTNDSDGFDSLIFRHTDDDGVHTLLMFGQNQIVECEEAEFGPYSEPSPITGTTGSCVYAPYLNGQITLTQPEQETFDRLTSGEAWNEYRKVDASMGLRDTCGHQAHQFSIRDLHFLTTETDDTEFIGRLVDFALALQTRCKETMQPL